MQATACRDDTTDDGAIIQPTAHIYISLIMLCQQRREEWRAGSEGSASRIYIRVANGQRQQLSDWSTDGRVGVAIVVGH